MFASPFSFKGRIRRLEYGLSYILYMSFIVLVALLQEHFNFDDIWAVIPYLFFIAFLLAQGTKRCHDLGKSGFYQLIPFYVILMIFQEGEAKENRYGSNPKKRTLSTIKDSETPIVFSLQKLLVFGVPAMLLNILLIAIGIEYFNANVLTMLFWIAASIFTCNFLMLLANGFGSTIEDHTRPILLFNLLFSFVLYVGVRFYSVYFGEADFAFNDLIGEFVLMIMFYVLTLCSFLVYYLIDRHRTPKSRELKYHVALSTLLFVSIFIFGFSNKSTIGNKEIIKWAERKVNWEDFRPVNYMEEDYVATIYSNIACPNLITDNNSRVYAYMNPNLSERLKDEYNGENVLVHEQYHFNITEYCARLLRRDIVQKGLGGLSLKIMKELKGKYAKKLDSLQNVYDSITDHNSNWKEQRQWELQVDDWLRQTAYYENEDVYDYYDFTKNRTRFYRGIYFTFTHKVLTSYPVGEKDIKYGESYEILYRGPKEKIVKFYKNGDLVNGGYFKTAIAKITEKEKGVFELHYLNADESYNQKLAVSRRKTFTDDNNNQIVHYFDHNGERVEKNSIYETRWKYNSDDGYYYATYFNRRGTKTVDNEGIHHEKRVLDLKDRTIIIETFDRRNRLKNDSKFIARRQLEFDDNNRKVVYQLFDENENFALHLSDYHLAYDYDERGNTIRVTSLNENGKPTYDDNGASIYEFTFDLFDRETQVKRYNSEHQPIIANDDYYKWVKEYDSLGRVQLEAFYYPNHVLKYSDAQWGATKYTYEGDSIVKEYNIDVFGDVIKNENNVAIIKKTFDDKRQLLSKVYLDIDGSFAKMDDKVMEYRYKYDNNGRKRETAVYDSLGRLKAFEADVAIIRWEYDENGNKSKTTYFNVENQLAHTADSVTYNIYKYRKDGKLLERSNNDINMNPALIDGAFKTKFTLNKAGLDSVKYEYDTSGKLKKGVAITRFYYNKYNNKIRTEFYDSANKRIKNSEGVSATNVIFNERQYRIGYEYLDERNQPTNNRDGIAFEKWELDELGHTKSFSYFDKNLNPVIGPTGYHKIEHKWAAVGETSKTAIYGADLLPIEDEYGTAIYEYLLEPSGMYSQIKRYNKQGELSENTLGAAISKYTPYLDGLYYLEEELNAAGEVVNDSISK